MEPVGKERDAESVAKQQMPLRLRVLMQGLLEADDARLRRGQAIAADFRSSFTSASRISPDNRTSSIPALS